MGPALRTPLMDWAVDGTFSRASVATTRPNDQTIARIATGVRRFEQGRLLIEQAQTFSSRYSEDLSDATWVKTNCTISTDTTTAPDGTLTADTLTTTSGGVVTSIALTTGSVPAGNTSFTFFARANEAYTASYTYAAGAATTSADFSVDTTWRQLFNRIGGASVAPTITIRPHTGAGTGTAGRVMQVWGLGIVNQSFTGSYVTTTSANVTRSADSLTYSAGQWNTLLATSAYSFEWRPAWDSGGLNAIAEFLSFGGASDRFAINNTDQILITVGGVANITTSAITWSRDQVIKLSCNPVAGSVTIAGASSGNGTYTGTPWTWPTGVTLRVGGRVGSTAEINGCISNPYPV
jgi:hypothetical protein